MTCIFGSKDQWASIRKIDPYRFDQWARLEKALVKRRNEDLKKGVKNAKSRITQVNDNKTWTRKWVVSLVRRKGVPPVAKYLGVDPEALDRFRKSKAKVFKLTGDSREVIEELLDHHGAVEVEAEEGIPARALEEFMASNAKTFVVDRSLPALAASGTPFESLSADPVRKALSPVYRDRVIMRSWNFPTPSGAPAGAFGEDYGPT